MEFGDGKLLFISQVILMSIVFFVIDYFYPGTIDHFLYSCNSLVR